MTEETEKTLSFAPGGECLYFNPYVGNSENDRFNRIRGEIEDKLANGEPVYAQIKDDRRKGSICRIKNINFHYSQSSGYWGRTSMYVSDLEVEWDGRKNTLRPYASEVEYLPDWTEGTVWNWTKSPPKPAEEVIPQHDHLGELLEPGQFVCFVHRRYGVITMKFGTITRITPRGTVFIKSLKLREDDDESAEVRALDSSELIIVNDKLQSRLVMARLSAA